MERAQSILSFCEFVSYIFILAFLVELCRKIYRRIKYEEPITLTNLMWRPNEFTARKSIILIAWALVIGAGIANIVFRQVMASTQIGAFYEKNSYEETYEATVYLDEKPIFCLADMRREVDAYDDGRRGRYSHSYRIDTVYLPYGETVYADVEYSPEEKNTIFLGEWGVGVEIILDRPADEASPKKLANEVVTAYGPLCGSRKDGIYHHNDCLSAGNVSDSNKIFFSSEKEASALGYVPCGMCCAE